MLAINNSLPCCKSELDLFATFPSNTSILNSEIKTIVADNNVKDQSVIQFTIKPTPDYINLSETKLYFKVSLNKKDGTPVTATSKVGVINNFGHSLFKKIELPYQKQI